MNCKFFVSCFAAIAVFTIASCKTSYYVPTEQTMAQCTENGYKTSLEELNKGRDLYMGKCGKCHSLYKPKQFSAEQWKINLSKMQPKAKITDEEKWLIFTYVNSCGKIK
ncbi:cytochrome C [Sphingobacteriales bacterium UPWRP_1]|nr:hypothetical protein BVG80_10865 [Sphingobacteriales bacterium TSM_CSM]PSJ77420.1 cytochrome C [Sphingobacteriales bacterium UPWRP_1]